MKEIVIKPNEAGQRLDKLLKKYLSEAPGSFIYKMLRKKNIVLNGKKATGNEKLSVGDSVKLFLADETIQKFSSPVQNSSVNRIESVPLDIVYEDKQILLINKPSGMLSQRAEKSDVSVVEYVISYLINKKEISEEDLKTFRPSTGSQYQRIDCGWKDTHLSTDHGTSFERKNIEKVLSVHCKRKNSKAQAYLWIYSKR